MKQRTPKHRTLQPLLPAVREAGRVAMDYYRAPHAQGVTRKRDGSLVTAADKAVEAHLEAAISALYPDAGIVAEEGTRVTREPGAWTFVVDPIDGTEAFTCGTPAWCIAIGVLDAALEPLAGIVHAPAWGSTWIADTDPDQPALMDGDVMGIIPDEPPRELTVDDTLLVDSKAHRTHRLRGYPGKARSYGSTALHAVLVASQTGFAAAQLSAAMAWDVAAPHAICRRVGVAMHLHEPGARGSELRYGPLIGGASTNQAVLVAPPHLLESLVQVFVETD